MSTQPIPSSLLDDFVAAARRIGAHGLARCSSGNLSCRIDSERMLVKASGAWMSDLTRDDIALCRIADGSPLDGKTPSVEIGFHAGVLRTRPDVSAVLHFQSPAATAVACSRPLPDFSVTIEIPYYIGPVAVVPYISPGSPDLAAAVVAALRDHNLAILQNHGQVTAGKSFNDVIQKATFFELACDIILRAGDRVHPLPPDAVTALRAAARAGFGA